MATKSPPPEKRRKEEAGLIAAEKKHIRSANPDNDRPFAGLALSGGGIRSASFALGVMQMLAGDKKDKISDYLSKFDYLSTVSGGGYIGSALSWFREKDGPGFPFGKKMVGARSGEDSKSNRILDFIRQHGNYLTPDKDLDIVSLGAVAIRSIFLSLFVYLSFLTVGMSFLNRFNTSKRGQVSFFLEKITGLHIPLNDFLGAALFITILLAVVSLVFSICTAFKWSTTSGYRRLLWFQKSLGLFTKIIIGFALLGSLPYLADHLNEVWKQISAAGGTTLLGVILTFFQMRKNQSSARAEGKAKSSSLQIYAISFLLIYGLMLTAFLLANSGGFKVIIPILAAAALIIGFFVNLNHAGLHRMYRDRLMETFMPDPESVARGKWGPAIAADKTLLENICPEGMTLYQLINTNVVLVDSADAKFRGRGGDSFLLSRLFCGSYATGWCKTANFMKNRNPALKEIFSSRGLTLPTAMAISGAAANPNSGVAGKGVTRSKLVSILMTLLNLRLGYWAPNPTRNGAGPMAPNYIFPGIFPGMLTGLFGFALDENSFFVELSDGGHFENLALYELIRREVGFIVATDGGADPKYTFEDLANAVERVRVDFGVKISFRSDEDCALEGILPQSAADGLSTQKYELAIRGFAIADIIYGEDKPNGTLIYLKPTLTPDLPADIYGYKSSHSTFPDQTTADQFFDEAQFEAYRELGFQLAKQMLNQKAARTVFKKFFK